MNKVTKGTTPTTLGYEFKSQGINFIKGESFREDHSLDKTMFAHIDEETNLALSRSIIKQGDILFSIAGTLGKFSFAHKEILPANTNQAVAIIRPNEKQLRGETLFTYFLAGWHDEFYKRHTQQAVQANLSLATIKDLHTASRSF